jgi:hypothetical protein
MPLFDPLWNDFPSTNAGECKLNPCALPWDIHSDTYWWEQQGIELALTQIQED